MKYPQGAIEEILKYAVYLYQLHDQHTYQSMDVASVIYARIEGKTKRAITNAFGYAETMALGDSHIAESRRESLRNEKQVETDEYRLDIIKDNGAIVRLTKTVPVTHENLQCETVLIVTDQKGNEVAPDDFFWIGDFMSIGERRQYGEFLIQKDVR